MTIKTIKLHICDLCESEDGKEVVVTHQYSDPELLNGFWFDGCKKHIDQMRNTGSYKVRRIKQEVE